MARRKALTVCSRPGCPRLTSAGRCTSCRADADQQRGNPRQRGYGQLHEQRFRPGVLARDPACTCTATTHGHGAPCGQPSRHADHWPRDRRELVALGLDPDDPANGRGLCHPCHSRHTATTQPGGWNR